eukprot:COSAG06_NODE_1665_length_8759_cov_38.346189_2_plen_97_part_00
MEGRDLKMEELVSDGCTWAEIEARIQPQDGKSVTDSDAFRGNGNDNKRVNPYLQPGACTMCQHLHCYNRLHTRYHRLLSVGEPLQLGWHRRMPEDP